MVDSLLMRRLNAGANERDGFDRDCSSKHSVTSALTAEESISSHPSVADTSPQVPSPSRKSKSSKRSESGNKKPSSHRRRSSLKDSLGVEAAAVDPSDLVDPQKPRSQRRRSLFGSTPTEDENQKKPSSTRRRSMLGSISSSDCDTIATPDVSDDSLDPSDQVVPKKPSSRRRGSFTLFCSSDAEEEKKPSSVRRRSLLGSVLHAADSEHSRSTKDAESVASKSVNSKASSLAGNLAETPPPKPKNRRRMSLGNDEGKKEKNKKKDKSKKRSDDEPKKPSSRRRNSIGSTHSESADHHEKPRSRRNSLSCASSHSVSSVENNINVHEYITDLRTERGLQPFSRNMLMDTIAKQISRDLASSKGAKCTPTNYYGNVGQGESVGNILETMTTRKGTARENILNPHFREFGLGMTKGKDGLIYMCQVFK